MILTVEEFIKLRNIIYDKAGIFFETKKIYYVNKRVEKRMEALSINDVNEYFNYLKFRDKPGTEIQHLLNLITTNETYFFREDQQLKVFLDHCLPEILAVKRQSGDNRIRIWSAGCSSGEEPYTLAILLREGIPDISAWKVEIIANDIDTDILQKAREGYYQDRSLRFVSPYIVKKYFKQDNGNYIIDPAIKQMVQFYHMNLMDSPRMRLLRNMDFIFCRNVLIYFDDVSRKAVMANFYDSLNPGGYIYLGHSESVTRISSAYTIKRQGNLLVHQKPRPQEV